MEARIRASLVALFAADDLGLADVRKIFRGLFDEVKHVDPNADDAMSAALFIVLAEAALKVRGRRVTDCHPRMRLIGLFWSHQNSSKPSTLRPTACACITISILPRTSFSAVPCFAVPKSSLPSAETYRAR